MYPISNSTDDYLLFCGEEFWGDGFAAEEPMLSICSTTNMHSIRVYSYEDYNTQITSLSFTDFTEPLLCSRYFGSSLNNNG